MSRSIPRLVIAGTQSGYWSSRDGVKWTVLDNPPVDEGSVLAFGGDRFLAVGASAYISTDGVAWSKHTLPVGAQQRLEILKPIAGIDANSQSAADPALAGRYFVHDRLE